jgi:nucleoside-diphosphate-sugar epimerase
MVKLEALVAGGGGFIGSRLVRALLARNWSVRVLDVEYGDLEKYREKLEFFGVGSDDLRGGMVDRNIVKQAVKGVDVVYHLALNWDGATWKHQNPISDLFDANIRGTFNLLEEVGWRGLNTSFLQAVERFTGIETWKLWMKKVHVNQNFSAGSPDQLMEF